VKTADVSLNVILVIGSLLVAYLMSPPFIVAGIGLPFIETHAWFFDVLFAPAGWLFDHFPPYRLYIEHSFRLLGVR